MVCEGKEKKAAEEWRRLEAGAEAKRKAEEEVRHKAAEQEQLRIAKEAYMKKTEEEVWKCKEAKEEAKKWVSDNRLRADAH